MSSTVTKNRRSFIAAVGALAVGGAAAKAAASSNAAEYTGVDDNSTPARRPEDRKFFKLVASADACHPVHIQAGDDEWEPTPEEMEALAAAFSDAEADPASCIVTRPGVRFQTISQYVLVHLRSLTDVRAGDVFFGYERDGSPICQTNYDNALAGRQPDFSVEPELCIAVADAYVNDQGESCVAVEEIKPDQAMKPGLRRPALPTRCPV